jgi:hypothetical protein
LGCTDTVNSSVILTDFDVSVTSNSLLCNGTNTGSVTLSATGGTTPYSYDWTNSTSTSSNISGLSGGTYECVVVDADGCIDTVSAIVTEPSELTVSVVTTDEVSGNDGAIDLSVSGGTSPYQFIWSNGSTAEDVNNLVGDDYIFTITDANGCTYSDTVTVESTVGINDYVSNIIWSVYPNPGRELITITGEGIGNLEVMDVNGKLIVSTFISTNSRSVNLSNLDRGTYLIRFNDSIKRWIKQ